MPPLTTHLVVGERVFPRVQALPCHTYGAFLLGCLVVDVNSFVDIPRRRTHLVGRVEEDGADAFTKSCTNFLEQRKALLNRPWESLNEAEQAFVAGYLCHLAADEPWKAWGAELMELFQIESMDELPVPGSVTLTAFSALSADFYIDIEAVFAALKAEESVPDVFTHVTHADFQTMWQMYRPALSHGDHQEQYFATLQRIGLPETEVQIIREMHNQYWKEAIALIKQLGGVEPFIGNAVTHALEVLPRLSFNEHTSEAS